MYVGTGNPLPGHIISFNSVVEWFSSFILIWFQSPPGLYGLGTPIPPAPWVDNFQTGIDSYSTSPPPSQSPV